MADSLSDIDDTVLIDCCYCNIDEIDELHLHNVGQGYCALLNIHSLLQKVDNLKDLVHDIKNQGHDVHFIMLCETYLIDTNVALCNMQVID